MELLTGGNRQISNATCFAQQISPLPSNENFLVSNPTAVIQSSPPQKLRPIRKSPSSSQGNDLPLTGGGAGCCGGMDGTLDNLGLLVDQVCGVNGEVSEFFKPPVKADDSEIQCTGSGGSDRVGRKLDPNCQVGLLEVESSSSSGDDSLAGITEHGSGKRRRKTRQKLENFVESLVMKVLEKQERMHQQLIETMERRERERIVREEAWKQQEIDRMKRDEEVRAQENARNLALISFIQDVMGHKVEVPHPLTSIISLPEKVGDRNGSHIPIQKDFNSDSSNRRWPEAEVQALIMLRTALEQKFRVMGAKCSNVWDEISVGMGNMGYNRTPKKCKEKWENINKYFRKSMGSGGKKRYENSKSCPYFRELDFLYKNGFVNPGNVSDHTNIENETNNSEEVKTSIT